MVWELDPAAQILTVYRQGFAPCSLGASDILDGADVLPELSVPIASLFPPNSR